VHRGTEPVPPEAMDAVTISPCTASDDGDRAIEENYFHGERLALACACAYLLFLFDGCGHLGHRARRRRPTGARRRGATERAATQVGVVGVSCTDHPDGISFTVPGQGPLNRWMESLRQRFDAATGENFMDKRYLGQKE